MMNRYLCDDILHNIFTKLPAISIIRFLIICKQWCGILTDSAFWENHRICNPYPNLVFISKQKNSTSLIIKMPSCREIICRVDDGRYCFGGTVNGLILLASIHGPNFPLIIVNPITRQHTTISFTCKFRCICGFGYSPLSKQYKMLIIDDSFYSEQLIFISNIRVWTLGSAEPARVVMEDCDYLIRESLCIDGTIYVHLTGPSESLLEFDVEEETCRIVECPFKQSCSKLMQLGDRLCMASLHKDDISLWVLGDNGWETNYILKDSAENKGVLSVWEFECTLLVHFWNTKFLVFDRKSGEKRLGKGEIISLGELEKSFGGQFVECSKFFDKRGRFCLGYVPSFESPKIFENVLTKDNEASTGSCGAGISYDF